MGFISRKLMPACGNACLCCPALTPSSRRPVKRYKKLLAEIFPKNLDSAPNERKIMKLCEYAAKNHARIPKIAKFLEQKCYKELQSEQYHFIKIIMEVYSKLLYICKEQIAYFAGNLLNVIVELLDAKQQDSLRILGCQTLTTFIYGQVDSTYARSIDALVPKIVLLARENGGEHYNLMHVASLQCLSAMVWFMTESSYLFTDLEKIIHATLENYGMDEQSGNDYERRAQHHNWVDEVTGCEIRPGPMKHNDASLSTTVIRSWPVTKEFSILTREESQNPKVWSQICIQKLAELAKETTTMRQILDPMFIYFDMGRHWAPHQGLAIYVLSDIAYFSKSTGSEQFILVSLIRHVDHKNVMHDPQLKSNIIQIAACLVKQLRLRSVVIEIGVVSDLCRHLRKSLQAIVETVGPEEASLNTSLQNSIEDCLLEIAKGIGDASPFFDMITLTLEKLPISSNVARATIGSLLIIADVISQTSVPHSQLIFPDALLLQLLKAMLYPDVEARVGAHLIFWVILAQIPIHPKHDSEFLHKSMRRHSRTFSAFASATALFEKLRRGRGRGYENADKYRHDINEESNIKEMCEDEWRHGWQQRSSPYFNKLSCSMVDRANISTNYLEADVNFMMLTEDQIAQLLSGFWRQAHQPDNMPSNYEAIAHSFSMTILSSHLKNPNQNVITRFFQLPLSLTSALLDPAGVLPPTSQRSLLTLSLGMLAFTGIIFHIPELTDTAKLLMSFHVDPYLKICDDLQLHTRPESDIKEYGSEADQEASKSSIAELRLRMLHCGQYLINIIVQHLSRSTNMTEKDLIQHLSEAFTPEDVPFGANLFLCWDSIKALATCEESLSFDEVHSRNSSIDGDGISESPSTDLPEFMPKMVASSVPQFISAGQLLESALHVAGEVAGTVVSTSPLPYGTIASQCESFVMGTRKRLSTWLVSAHDSVATNPLHLPHTTNNSANAKVRCTSQEEQVVPEPWRPLRLPPASPFDNFLRAAGC